ncbi:MAG: helical backbone metal receptor [Deltaproteobacteria bacterium]|nr:helical backbone metal receptor [Deltaproteobacteria bacterium]
MKNYILPVTLFLGFSLACWSHQALGRLSAPPPWPTDPERIISLAPSVTETLYALGLGPRVVGVTQFCGYPSEVKTKPMVAGFSDVNYEAVVRQRPDLVVLPSDKVGNRRNLERLGLSVMTLNTRSLTGLMEAIKVLGHSTGQEAQAGRILDDMENSLARARARAAGRAQPKVLFSVMHSYQGLGYITEINAVGQDGFFSEMIRIAGGQNVYQGALSFPRLSREALIFLDPEVIIDIIPANEDIEAVRRDWLTLSTISAIRDNRLFFLTDEADTVPGPRFPQTLEKLSRAFHPEIPHAAP